MNQMRQDNWSVETRAAIEPTEGSEFDLHSVLGVLRRQLRLILLTVLLVVAVAGGAILVMKPVYSASTLILVDPSRKNLLEPEMQVQSGASDSARVESEVELVKSETTLLRAIAAANLVEDPEFGVRLGFRETLLAFLRIAQPRLPTGAAALQDVLANLRDAVSVQRRGSTYLIAVQVRSVSPARAALLANTIATAYIAGQLEAKIGSTLASRNIISGRIEEARDEVSKSEGAFDAFIDDNIEAITRETGRTDLATLRLQLEQINADRNRFASLADLASGSLARRDWAALTSQLQDAALAKLEDDRQRLQSTLAGTADGTPQAIDLKAELAKLETQMDQAAQAELTTLRQQVLTAQAEASDLRTQLRSGILATDLPANILTSIYGLQQNAELARSQYQTLLARLKDLDTQATLQVADSRVVSEALPPGEPSFPNPRLILSLAGVAALALGVGLAFLVENFVGGLTSEEQMRSVLRTSAVASIPRQRSARGLAKSAAPGVAGLVTSAPLSAFAEAVRRLRIGIDQQLKRNSRVDGGGLVIMVTSAAPNEGKTTIALSLARTYALSGRSTLLIDCDMRKPSVHRHLGLEPSSGLLDYLAQGRPPSELPTIMTIDPPSGAQVIVGARRSEMATDHLVTGAAFGRLLKAARDNFEVVILDTPPIGPVVDGLYLAQFAHVVAYVVRWASTSQQDARSGFAAVVDALPPDTGVVAVLNQQDLSRSSYRYAYSDYYTEH